MASMRGEASLLPRRSPGQNGLAPAIGGELRDMQPDPTDGQETADASADDRDRNAPQLGHQSGFQLSKLRAAHEEDLVDARHSAAQLIRCAQLPDRVSNDHAHTV